MIINTPNPSQLSLEALALDSDGTAKTNIISASVRVYHMVGAVETEVLAPTALVQVGATSTWRYIWAPVSLAVDNYVAEYTFLDTEGYVGLDAEDISIEDFAQQSTLVLVQTDTTLIRKVETGRWKIDANQMTFYDDDGSTPLLVFNLKDSTGAPTMADVFERIEAP